MFFRRKQSGHTAYLQIASRTSASTASRTPIVRRHARPSGRTGTGRQGARGEAAPFAGSRRRRAMAGTSLSRGAKAGEIGWQPGITQLAAIV
jgi:hypothetical protein